LGLILLWALASSWAGGCSDDDGGREIDAGFDAGEPDGEIDGAPGDAEVDADIDAEVGEDGGTGPNEAIDEICGTRAPDDTAQATELNRAVESPAGVLPDLVEGDVEAVGFIIDHPFRFDSAELYLSGQGELEFHVWPAYFRSQPELGSELTTPQVINVDGEDWYEVQFPMVWLDPSQHFWVGVVHLSGSAHFVLGDGTSQYSMFKSPSQIDPPFQWAGIGGDVDYMVKVHGEYFCPLEERFFNDRTVDSGLALAKGAYVALGDYDGDGDDDALVHTYGNPAVPELWRNDGNLQFSEALSTTDVTNTYSNFGVFGDLDNDGDQDLYFGVNTPQDGSDPGTRSSVWLNDGDATYTKVDPSGVEISATSAAGAMADYDGDGYLDIYVGNWLLEYPQPDAMHDFLFHSNGDGTFTEMREAAGMDVFPSACYGVTWCDANDDGWPDVVVGNYGYGANFLFLNEQDGTFEEVGLWVGMARDDIDMQGGNTFGIDCGDYDNDGHLDLFVSEIAHPRYQPWSDPSRLLRWAADGDSFVYEDVTETAGIPRDEGMIDPSWVDYDNDGDRDLFVSVLYYPWHFSRLFRNNGDGTFDDVTYQAGLWLQDGQAGVWSDFDGDGDMDLLATTRRAGGTVFLYENTLAAATRWVQLRLEGSSPSNRDAIGARVTATTGSLMQIREVKGGKGHGNTASTRVVHFGFGNHSEPIDITVRWPSGLQEQFVDVAENTRHDLVEGTGQPL
jgi:hypothetical protein